LSEPVPNPPPRLGVVIPTLDESESLPFLLSDLGDLPIPHEVVVVDGGSADGTRSVAATSGARVLNAPRGRARQMNAGAAVLETPWILFLHADSRLPGRAGTALGDWLSGASPDEVGHFGFALQDSGWFWRFIELGQRVREGLSGLVYGDQGLVLSRGLFETAGGFPDLPLMEDLEMVRLLRRIGRIRRIPASLPSSPRRYREVGQWRGWLRNTALVTLYLAGIPPSYLARSYSARRHTPATDRTTDPVAARRMDPSPAKAIDPAALDAVDAAPVAGVNTAEARTDGPVKGAPSPTRRKPILLVFAKAPVPGQVKTRLAAEVGPEEAARIYGELGRRVVDQVREGSHRTVVVFDPPGARAAVEAWLGVRRLEFRPQASGDLGQRLEAAFQWAFQESDRVLAVGTDAPGVDSEAVEAAARYLEKADMVLGPALDGGYYLLGLRRLASELFREIPWSTAAVLEATRARGRQIGFTEVLLPPLSDLDTLEDWRRLRG
jgi:rSAM/selenodomain-associated transferase 2/rSAM/selenodomain-associated transferase 1